MVDNDTLRLAERLRKYAETASYGCDLREAADLLERKSPDSTVTADLNEECRTLRSLAAAVLSAHPHSLANCSAARELSQHLHPDAYNADGTAKGSLTSGQQQEG